MRDLVSLETPNPSFRKVVLLVCIAQTFATVGAFSVPALLPNFIDLWRLTNTEAGWITGGFYLAYVLTVPILVSLTDRVDPKKIYLIGVGSIAVAGLGYAWLAEGFWSALAFRALWGVGWAGSYMPGLKALSDLVEGPQQSRAVAAHAASVGISSAASFIIAGLVAGAYGWRWGIALGGFGAIAAGFLIAVLFPARTPKREGIERVNLFDFRPIFRNRSAMAYSIGYGVHTFEMSALRNWVVAFLTFAAAYQGVRTTVEWATPTAVATAMGLGGVLASVFGNEMARRLGRRRWILLVMGSGTALAAGFGFSPGFSYSLTVGLVLIYGGLIWADSACLTAGTAGSAEPGQRGATLAVHSMLGYAGGFIGPLVIGIMLDIFGADTPTGWGLAFFASVGILLLGPVVIIVLKPASLDGDRKANTG